MNARKRNRTAGLVAIATGTLLLAGHATAATVTADYITYAGGTASGAVQVSAPPAAMTPASGGGGIFQFVRTASTGSVPPLVSNAAGRFLGICLEFSETLLDPATYTFDDLGAAPINGSAAPTMSAAGLTGSRADDLRRLLGHVLPNFAGSIQNTTVGGITADQARLALQLAVWEIANENFGGGAGQFAYGMATGYLQVTSANANALNQANAWLGALNAGWTPLSNVYALINERIPGQDFVVQVVPIPAAAWLLGSGLLGLFGLARRKKVTS